MERNEAILLLEVLLQDIRGNWGSDLMPRVNLAEKLANECKLIHHIGAIEAFREHIAEGYTDGRFFRMHHSNGGYEDMGELHGLPNRRITGRSPEFQQLACEFLTYPENRFDDLESWETERWSDN